MRTTIPFDTHAFVKRRTATGVPEPQAEVHAQAIADLVNDELPTKRDLEALRIATKQDLAELEARLGNELSQLELRLRSESEKSLRESELRLTLRLGGLIAAAIAIVAAIVKLV
jgi:hypothetical protein